MFIPGGAADPRQLVGEESRPIQTNPCWRPPNYNKLHLSTANCPFQPNPTFTCEGETWSDPTSAGWSQVLWEVKLLTWTISHQLCCRQTARDEIILDLDVTWAGESDIQVRLIFNLKQHKIQGEPERHASFRDGPLPPRQPEDCLETTAPEVATCRWDAGVKIFIGTN